MLGVLLCFLSSVSALMMVGKRENLSLCCPAF